MVCKMPISKMSDIDKKLPKGVGNNLELRNFSQACHSAAEFVSTTLEPLIGLKLNAKKRTHTHSVNQILSMISRCIVGMYDVDNWKEKETWPNERDVLMRTLKQHYLVDLLQHNWRGSGDSRLFNMTWNDSSDSDNKLQPSRHYLEEFLSSEMNDIMNNWFNDQLRKKEKKRFNAKDDVKTFLRYLYSNSVSYMNNSAQCFEIEHLFPVSRLQKLISPQEEGWAINCVGNLALFVDKTNREKGGKTLSEYLKKLTSEESTAKMKELEGMLFCEFSDVEINKQNGIDRMRIEDYNQFLRSRFESMKEKVISNLDLFEATNPEIFEVEEKGDFDEDDESVPHNPSEIRDILPIIEIVPSLTIFGAGYFTIPVEHKHSFIHSFKLSAERKSVRIKLSISGDIFTSAIRYQNQKKQKREVAQFLIHSDAKNALSNMFHQSFLDLNDNLDPSERCIFRHEGEDLFTVLYSNEDQ